MAHFKAGQLLTAGQINNIAHQGIQLLEEQVLETDSDSVVFSDIPQQFRNLQVYLSGGATGEATQIDAYFNGDTSGNYDSVAYVLRASDVYEAFPRRDTAGIEVSFFATTSLMNSGSFIMSGYSRSDRQKLLFGDAVSGIDTGVDNDTLFNHEQGYWKANAAVTQLSFIPRRAAQIAAGSIFQVYGLGAAQV